MLIIVLAMLVTVALAVWGFLSLPTTISNPAPRPSSSPTVSAWDETSSPNPTGARPGNCAAESSTVSPSGEGVLTVGRLSMARPKDWRGPVPENRTPLTSGGWGFAKTLPEKMGWASSMTIGLVGGEAPQDSKVAARTILQCVLTSSFYSSVTVTMDDYEITELGIGGTSAVQADAQISFDHPNLRTKGSRLRLLIVNTTPQRAFFFAAVPKENDEHIRLVDATTKGLKVVG